MYRSPGDILELRERGRPWLVAAILLVIIVIAAGLVFILMNNKRNETVQLQVEPTSAQAYSTFSSLSANQLYTVEDTLTTTTTTTPTTTTTTSTTPPSTAPTPFTVSTANNRTFSKAAVTSSVEICSEIGRNVLMRGGNAIDAAIASEVCVSGLHPHSTGLGGGLIMVIHNKEDAQSFVINALSKSPRSATERMFINNYNMARRGYSSIACPGFLSGLWTAFKRFGSGKVAWQDLLTPTIELLERGFPVSFDLAEAIRTNADEIWTEPTMNIVYSASISEGDIVRDPRLAATLRRLATSRDPMHLFYKGDMASEIALEIKKNGGLLTKMDLVNYSAKVKEPLISHVSDAYRLIGPLPPSTFALSQLMVGIMKKKGAGSGRFDVDFVENMILSQRMAAVFTADIGDPSLSDESRVLALNLSSQGYHHVLSEKLTEQKNRITPLPEATWRSDRIGSHTNVMDSAGITVSLSSTINSKFGSLRRSSSLGFVWNNQMESFSSEGPDDVNSVEASKIPRTGCAPMILVRNDTAVLSLGVTGSQYSFSAAAQVLLNWLSIDLQSSVDLPRFYATSSGALFESSVPMSLLSALQSRGISLNPLLSTDTSVNILERTGNLSIRAICDYRGTPTSCSNGY